MPVKTLPKRELKIWQDFLGTFGYSLFAFVRQFNEESNEILVECSWTIICLLFSKSEVFQLLFHHKCARDRYRLQPEPYNIYLCSDRNSLRCWSSRHSIPLLNLSDQLATFRRSAVLSTRNIWFKVNPTLDWTRM